MFSFCITNRVCRVAWHPAFWDEPQPESSSALLGGRQGRRHGVSNRSSQGAQCLLGLGRSKLMSGGSMLGDTYVVRNSIFSAVIIISLYAVCASGQSLPPYLAPSPGDTLAAAHTPEANSPVLLISVVNAPLGMRPWSRTRRLSLSPASLAFGSVAVNTTSAKSVSIINSSRTSVTISQANVTGAAYSVTGLTLPFTLEARSRTS